MTTFDKMWQWGGGTIKDVQFKFGAYRSNTSICLHTKEDLERERERKREQRLPLAPSTSLQHEA